MFVDLADQVTGYLDEGQVELICEIYGFRRSTNLPTWLGRDGNPIDSSNPSKYMITFSISSQPALLISNGASVPGIRSTLTIRQLEEGDAGGYTCVADGNSSVVHLQVVPGTPPQSTSPSPHTTCESCNWYSICSYVYESCQWYICVNYTVVPLCIVCKN